MDAEKEIRSFVVESFLPGKAVEDIKADESILESGLLDSAGIFELVAFLESKFDIEVNDEEIIPDNFDSVRSIAQMVQSKLS